MLVGSGGYNNAGFRDGVGWGRACGGKRQSRRLRYICLFIKKQREWVSQCKTQRRDVAIRYKTLAACGPLVQVRVCACGANLQNRSLNLF